MTGPVLEDSRRLTGANLLTPGPAAVIDIHAETSADIVDRWHLHVKQMLDALGWGAERTFVRSFSRGASLAFSAPIDALYAATEVNEWAFEAAVADLDGTAPPAFQEATGRLRDAIAQEANPRLLELQDAATARGIAFVWDDDMVSLGMGKGSIAWQIPELPDPGDVRWGALSDIPIALVTGSNGKTTTVRLLAAVASAAGHNPGFSSTDGVFVGNELVDGGDYSGPGGARAVLRDRRVDVAILETARGGLLRRGLGVPHADAAIVTNIAMDHFGEYGVDGLDDIADAKLIVSRALVDPSHLILNAEDPTLSGRAPKANGAPGWYAVDSTTRPGLRAWVKDDVVYHDGGDGTTNIAGVSEIPITLGGAAQHNVSNVLGAVCVARLLGFSYGAIQQGLVGFEPDEHNSPGRTNVFRGGGITVVVDFAHNPEGMDALVATVRRLPYERTVLVIGQAGDRDDESIRAFARSAARLNADLIVLKEMQTYLRGRALGVVPDIIEAELQSGGAREITRAPSEITAVEKALGWARPGDIVVLPTHEDREGVLRLVREFMSSA